MPTDKHAADKHACQLSIVHMLVLLSKCAQDRAMYAVGTLISGNSAARSFIFFYALALHAVIFLILARCVPAVCGPAGAGWFVPRRCGLAVAMP